MHNLKSRVGKKRVQQEEANNNRGGGRGQGGRGMKGRGAGQGDQRQYEEGEISCPWFIIETCRVG